MLKRFLTLALVSSGLTSWAQPKEPYVFKHEKRNHMKQARKARAEKREVALHQFYDLNVWTRTMTHQAKVNIYLKKEMNAEISICDMQGNVLEQLHLGKLKKGKHAFSYEPAVTIHRPLVCVLRVDGKMESMKVMRFNSF